MATRMQQKRGTAAEWAAANPVLSDGEIGYESDTGIMKVGNGSSTWNQLLSILESAAYLPLNGKAYDSDRLDGLDSTAFARATDLTPLAPKASPTFTGTVTAPALRLTGTGDASATSTIHAFQIGPSDGFNVIIDQNEIIARNNGVLGGIGFGGNRLEGVAEPVAATHSATKGYVDGLFQYATSLSLNAGWTAFSGWAGLNVNRAGRIAALVGAIKVSGAKAIGTYTITTIADTGMRPPARYSVDCTQNGITMRIDVETTGAVNLYAPSALPDSLFVPINLVYPCAG